jgi:hypothetical protein
VMGVGIHFGTQKGKSGIPMHAPCKHAHACACMESGCSTGRHCMQQPQAPGYVLTDRDGLVHALFLPLMSLHLPNVLSGTSALSQAKVSACRKWRHLSGCQARLACQHHQTNAHKRL